MKLCWDSLNLLEATKFDVEKDGWNAWRQGIQGFQYIHEDGCIVCSEPFIAAKGVKTCCSKCKHIYQAEKQSHTKKRKNIIEDPMNCTFCGKECKNSSSHRNHERCCPQNPNRYILPNGVKGSKRHVVSNQFIKAKQEGKVSTHSDETRRKIRQANLKRNETSLWKKGLFEYDKYASQLEKYDEVRRDPEDERVLQVRCYQCKGWFRPTHWQIYNRLYSIDHHNLGESHFYHPGSKCRDKCTIFHKLPTPPKDPANDERYLQPAWRNMVLIRDSYTCQICGLEDTTGCLLIAHHIDPVKNNPVESADVDNGITLCVDCNKYVHSLPGCTTGYLSSC
jgi:hypothetical protein